MEDDTQTASLPGTTPSVGELSAEFAKQKRAKSPPLAFEPTPNDSLALLTSPNQSRLGQLDNISLSSPNMGRLSPLQAGDAQDPQIVVDQQASAIHLLHEAFAAERQAWSLERERLYVRIASLEKLLKNADGYSPAKSPVLSPFNGASISSPSSKATVNVSRLPSIQEDENSSPLNRRRSGAPQSIDISSTNSQQKTEKQHKNREHSVAFEAAASELIVEEIPTSPPETAKQLSPPPFNYRMEAGHTPLKAPRPPTPPPKNSMTMDGIEDTPTRNNTHINSYLTRSNDEDEDRELAGPLNMPELPHVPGDTNFTFDMLSKKLEQIEKDPEVAKPMVFKQPSPGLASPAEEERKLDQLSPKSTLSGNHEGPHSPPASRQPDFLTNLSSNALSPTTSATAPLSKEVSHEDKVQAEFESGGIRLKKKASVNFGAPFGSLGGFGGGRKHS